MPPQDFARIYSSLGLGKGSSHLFSKKNKKSFCFTFPDFLETISSLQVFRKRHSDAQRISNSLASQPTTIDFSHYRSVLKNKAIVDEAEKILKEFKPETYDVNTHIKAIETFEAKAVRTCFCFYSLENIFKILSPLLGGQGS